MDLGKDIFAVGFERGAYKAAVLCPQEDDLISYEGGAVFYDQLRRRIEGKGLVWLSAQKPVFAIDGLERLTKEELVIDKASQKGGCIRVYGEGIAAEGDGRMTHGQDSGRQTFGMTVRKKDNWCRIYPSVTVLPELLGY